MQSCVTSDMCGVCDGLSKTNIVLNSACTGKAQLGTTYYCNNYFWLDTDFHCVLVSIYNKPLIFTEK